MKMRKTLGGFNVFRISGTCLNVNYILSKDLKW